MCHLFVFLIEAFTHPLFLQSQQWTLFTIYFASNLSIERPSCGVSPLVEAPGHETCLYMI